MNICMYVRDAAEPTEMRPFAEAVTQELPEYSWTSPEASCERILKSVLANERVELVYKDNDLPAACAVLVAEDDDHVGPCLTVQWMYVMPPYRSTGLAAQLIEQAEQLARSMGLPAIAYTRRIGDVRYENTYRRLHG